MILILYRLAHVSHRVRMLFLFLLIASFGFRTPLATADMDVWKETYKKVIAATGVGQFEEAAELAKQAWELAEDTFGLEDVRTYGSEHLWLSIQQYMRVVEDLEPDEGVVQRLADIQDKAVIQQNVGFDMSWRYGEPSVQWPLSKHIIFTYKGHPNRYVGIYSPDLGDYLESLPEGYVRVVFVVDYELTGEVLSFHEIQIGNLTSWENDWGYSGVKGDDVPPPWIDYEFPAALTEF